MGRTVFRRGFATGAIALGVATFGAVACSSTTAHADELFTEEEVATNPCDNYYFACGAEVANATLGIITDVTSIGGGVRECILEAIPNLPFDIAEVRSMDEFHELLGFAGEKACDIFSCLPPAPWVAAARGACLVYRGVRGYLNCMEAEYECQMFLNGQPGVSADGLCGYSSVMACVSDGGVYRATSPAEIQVQCGNVAANAAYVGAQRDECVNNCVSNTFDTQVANNMCLPDDGGDDGVPPPPPPNDPNVEVVDFDKADFDF